MSTISQQITHSNINITPEIVMEHLCLYANYLSIINKKQNNVDSLSLYTRDDKKCCKNAHNPLANHPQSQCWMLFPNLRPARDSSSSQVKEVKVSSFHCQTSPSLNFFILDFGASAHMTSNYSFFTNLILGQEGVVHTGSENMDMTIEGQGTAVLSNELGSLVLHNFLFVPSLLLNLISVQCLLLEGYNVLFKKNHFKISKDNQLLIGRYHDNVPCISFSEGVKYALLSEAQFPHK